MNSKIFCGAILMLTVAYGCSNSNMSNPEKESGKHEADYSDVFSVKTGWDIYGGGGYRYGPSMLTNGDGTIDVWFAAPGDVFGQRRQTHNPTGGQSPVSFSGQDVAAQRFSSDHAFFGLGVICPNWGTTNSSLTLSLFLWKGDYSTSIAAPAIARRRYENFSDNQDLQLKREEMFPAGEYLWVLDQPAGTAGVWRKEGDVDGVINYLNGAEMNGSSFQAHLLLDRSSGGAYWDQAAYRRTADGGKTWTEEQMVLKPTEYSRDQLSICDPGAIKAGKYYYMGYTSTEDVRGLFNHAYIARSVSPTGPWEKWDGNGWSERPQPIVTFDGAADAWGAGEPSMVVNNDTLFFYYTWTDKDKNETRVATADANNEQWPSQLNFHGTAIDKTSIDGADHCDIKYRKDLKRYQAINTASRLTANSYIMLWESADGIRFSKKTELRDHLEPYLHNCGWSGDIHGHIDPAKPQFLAYAYGPNWGDWKTKWHPIDFENAK